MTVPHLISYNIKNTCLWIGLEIELDLVETARIKVIQERLRARKANRERAMKLWSTEHCCL